MLAQLQEPHINGVSVRAVGPGAPALQPRDQALAGDLATTAAFLVHQLVALMIAGVLLPAVKIMREYDRAVGFTPGLS